MTKITALKAQLKDQGRVSVFLEGKFAFGLEAETVYKFGLKIGKEYTENEISGWLKESEHQFTFDKVSRFVGLRPRSEKEVRDWFKRKEVPEGLQVLLMEKLKRLQLIDDRAFVKWWIEQRQTFKPRGSRLLTQELQVKGVDRKLIEQELAEVPQETGAIKELAVKKLKTLKRFPKIIQRKKLTDYLLRKGFNYSQIKSAVDELEEKA